MKLEQSMERKSLLVLGLEGVMPLFAGSLVITLQQPGVIWGDLQSLDWFLQMAFWTGIAILGGFFFLSASFLLFFLFYSPVYLARRTWECLTRAPWVDQNEFRFYLIAFGLFCLLCVLAVVDLRMAGALFIILVGFAQTLWRFFP